MRIIIICFLLQNLLTLDLSAQEPLLDVRDSSTYETIQIGGQRWMNENLRYATPAAVAYDDDSKYVPLYGYLYPFADLGEACPTGWRIPTTEDTQLLLQFLADSTGWRVDWYSPDDWQAWGRGDYGFKVKPAGWKNGRRYERMGKAANFWLLDPKAEDAPHVHHYRVKGTKGLTMFYHAHETHNPIREKRLFSVRCIEDNVH